MILEILNHHKMSKHTYKNFPKNMFEFVDLLKRKKYEILKNAIEKKSLNFIITKLQASVAFGIISEYGNLELVELFTNSINDKYNLVNPKNRNMLIGGMFNKDFTNKSSELIATLDSYKSIHYLFLDPENLKTQLSWCVVEGDTELTAVFLDHIIDLNNYRMKESGIVDKINTQINTSYYMGLIVGNFDLLKIFVSCSISSYLNFDFVIKQIKLNKEIDKNIRDDILSYILENK